jgi:hypothetical protein
MKNRPRAPVYGRLPSLFELWLTAVALLLSLAIVMGGEAVMDLRYRAVEARLISMKREIRPSTRAGSTRPCFTVTYLVHNGLEMRRESVQTRLLTADYLGNGCDSQQWSMSQLDALHSRFKQEQSPVGVPISAWVNRFDETKTALIRNGALHSTMQGFVFVPILYFMNYLLFRRKTYRRIEAFVKGSKK